MAKLIVTVLVLVCITSVLSLDIIDTIRDKILYGGLKSKIEKIKKQVNWTPKAPAQYFEQKLDHFDPQNTRTFKQRYYVNSAFWDKKGPVFYMLGGEGPEDSFWVEQGEMAEVAKTYHGLCVSLEHRYYGASQPFDIWNTTNFKYLTSAQALGDFADFQKFITDSYVKNPNIKWFVFGGSYPGCLSAWYKLKYPNLVVGSLAASGPVLAKEDHTGIDDYTIKNLQTTDPACVSHIHEAVVAIDSQLSASPESAAQLLEAFNCGGVTNLGDFGWAIYFPMFYNVFGLCTALRDTSDKIAAYGKFFKTFIQQLGVQCKNMNLQFVFNIQPGTSEKANPAIIGGRPWIYQSCTEFGYWHTGAKQNYLKSTFTNVKYHDDKCGEIYGVPIKPDTDLTNKIYGGLDIKTTNTIFWNGQADYWSELSIVKNISDSVVATYMPHGTHCQILMPSSAFEPADLKQSRAFVAYYIKKYFG